MQKYLRWSAILAVMLLVLAACGPAASPGESTEESAEASAGASEDIAAVCAADPFGCVEIAAGDPIRLASALSIVGDTAALGNDANFGIEVAIDDRGEVFGRTVDLVKEDAGCGEAEDGQTAAQAIVADQSIVGVIGTTCSRTAVPAMPVLAEAGLVMISPSNTAPSLTNPDNADFGGPFYFRTAYNDQVQGAAVAQFVCDELPEATTAATIHDGSPYAEQLQQVFVDDFAEICGGTTTTQEAINVGDQDFSTVLTTIGADSPDILFVPIFSPEGPLVTRQSQDVAGLADTILIGADGLKDGSFITAAGDIGEEIGMYFSGPDLNLGTAYTDDFLPKYLEKASLEQPLAPYHAHGFDAANIFFDAIEAVGLEDADGTLWIPRDAVREYVATLTDFPGLTGNLTCDEFGDCGSEFVSIAQLVDGVYSEVYTTRP
ncbi:MAG TPA: branched-chain amino acid ABC transporter substrate-binding protein [Candidatus Dormibacteraeota bacterium]|nr:branched-chain amino acid ABC transporter substrate-binding protein [Candidatus Dormibacteraeota bacterium]